MADHHPLGDIEYLRENHLTRYKLGFPILKELIQNSEDSNSTHFDYGWVEGIPDATHELLQSPALFILDNGEFQEKNAKSIRYILGGSSKPNERDSIGKFGLGLKSVFHLCEAFFYIAPEESYGKFKGYDIFNPWATNGIDDYHENWDGFSDRDRTAILKKLEPILKLSEHKDREKGFIIWIPLRKTSHRTIKNEEDGIPLVSIKSANENYFEAIPPHFLDSYETKENMSLLLPLLHTLTHIRYYHSTLEEPVFSIHFNEGIRRHKTISEITKDEPILLHGNLTAANIPNFEFRGCEKVFGSDEFQKILQDQNFPGKFKNIQPHTAITLSRWTSEENARFLIRTAVFLPIGNDYLKDSISSEFSSYCLTLHGYFFVDSARTGILGWEEMNLQISTERSEDDDESSMLQKKWNCLLYRHLLNYFLEDVLDKFVKECGVINDEISLLSNLLLKSPLFSSPENRNEICSQKQWVYRIQPSACRWELVGVDETVRSLPNIPPDWKAFPKLEKFGYCLILSTEHNLLAPKTSIAWKQDELCEILDLLTPKDIFSNLDSLSFLTTFLDEQKKDIINHQNVQERLKKFLREAFLEVDIQELQNENMLSHVQKLVSFISPEKRYSIKEIEDDENTVYEILKRLNELNLDPLLIIYTTFESNSSSKAKLKPEQADAILCCLSEILTDCSQNQRICYAIILQILKDLESLSDILDKISKKFLFYAYKYCERKSYLYSYANLKKSQSQGLLFMCDDNQTMIADGLNEAILDCDLIFVKKELAKILNKTPSMKDISELTHSHCLRLLAEKPNLSDPEQRVKLLKELISYV